MRHARANQGFRVWEPLTMRYGSSTFTHTETSKSYYSFPSALLFLLFFLCVSLLHGHRRSELTPDYYRLEGIR